MISNSNTFGALDKTQLYIDEGVYNRSICKEDDNKYGKERTWRRES